MLERHLYVTILAILFYLFILFICCLHTGALPGGTEIPLDMFFEYSIGGNARSPWWSYVHPCSVKKTTPELKGKFLRFARIEDDMILAFQQNDFIVMAMPFDHFDVCSPAESKLPFLFSIS